MGQNPSGEPHRRSYERLNINFPVSLVDADNFRQEAFLLNICARGACVDSGRPFKVDTRVEVMAAQSSFLSGPFEKKARVIWSRPLGNNRYCAGLDFGLDNMIELVKRPAASSPVSPLSAAKRFIRWFLS
jgi:hypothetical protein